MQNLMNNETLYNNILAAFKESYFEEIKQRIRRGKECNALNCHYNGGTVPYGYSVNEKREYVVDPLTAPVVVEIFEQYVNGQSVGDIQRALNTRNVAGAPLSAGRIRRMLNSRIYIGEYRYGNITIANGVPAIISNQLFEQVQNMIKNNAHQKEAEKNEF